MSSGTKIAWFLLKWIVVPSALGALGYFVIGPRIGQTGFAPRSTQPLEAQKKDFADNVTAAARAQDSAPRPSLPAPEVSVTSRPVDRAWRRERERERERAQPEDRESHSSERRPERKVDHAHGPDDESLPPIDDPASSGGMVDPSGDQSNP